MLLISGSMGLCKIKCIYSLCSIDRFSFPSFFLPSASSFSSQYLLLFLKELILPIPFTSFSLSDVLCDPTDLIWRKGTSFEAMTGHTASSTDGPLAEVFRVFLSCRMPRDLCTAPGIISFRRD